MIKKQDIPPVSTQRSPHMKGNRMLDYQSELLTTIFNQTQDKIVIHDKDLRYEMIVNPEPGYNERESIGRTDLELFEKEKGEHFYKTKKKVMETGISQSLSTSFVSEDHKEFFYKGIFIPRLDRHGVVNGIIGYLRDVSDLKWAENEIKWTLDSIKDGFFALDREWRFIYVNDAAEELVGSKREELLGKNHWEFYPETIGTEIEENYRLAASGRFMEWDNYYGHWDRWFHIRAYPRKGGGVSSFFQDVTERKRAEIAIRISEQKFSRAFMHSPAIIAMLSKSGVFLDINNAFLKILGYLRTEVIGRSLKDLHIVDKQTRLHLLRELRENQIIANRELIFRKKSGESITVLVSIVNIQVENDELRLNIAIDITELKKAKEELQNANRRLSRAQGIAHIGDWEDDLATGKLTWSKEMYHIMGLPPGQPVQLSGLVNLFPPEEYAKFTKALKDCLENGAPYRQDYRINRPDGSIIYIHDEGEVIRDASGNAVWMYGTTQDITSRVLSEQALRSSEEKYRLLADNIEDVIWTIDPRGKLTYVSPSVRKLRGYTAQEALQQTLKEMLSPPFFRTIKRRLAQANHLIKAGIINIPSETIEVEQPCKDGGKVWTEAVVKVLFDENNVFKGYLGSTRNISERKKSEEALARYNEQLRNFAGHNELIREQERMNLARDIHDILGSSLAGLKMELAVLKQLLNREGYHTKSAISEQIASMSEQIGCSVEVMRKIVRELRPGILDELGLTEALKWHAREVEKRSNLAFTLHITNSKIKFSKSQSIFIFRIFQEIMTNITLHAKATKVWIRAGLKGGNSFLLSVRDNGIGISDDAVARLDSFGLLGMKERAVLMDGMLQIKGREGKGTLVTLIVPIRETTQ